MTALVAALAAVILISTSLRSGEICVTEPETFPASGIEGWQGEQLQNAATIILTARELGLGRDAQILGVMTAMGESSLINIDYSDWETNGVTNPDGSPTSSIGLFQQQRWWGSVEERMDPTGAATLFFQRLVRIDGWAEGEPTEVIHRVQINSDPGFYARFEDDATAVVDELSGACDP